MKSMNRRSIILFAFLCFSALSLCAQPRFSTKEETVNLGQVQWKSPTTVTFTVMNVGDKPLVMTAVEPDCTCTVAQWTESPIQPGEWGKVDVTFDAEMLGHFMKSVAVYMNAEPHLVYLHLKGQVVAELTDFTQTHPIQIGELRVDKMALEFPDVNMGDSPVIEIKVANLSQYAYEPTLMHLPPYLVTENKPRVLQPGKAGLIRVKLLSEKLPDMGMTQTSVYLSRFVGDKVSVENEIPVNAVLLPDFSNLTPDERARAPRIELSASELDMTQLPAKKSKVKIQIAVSNKGQDVLQINRLQVSHPSLGVSMKKRVLAPGEMVPLKVTINRRLLTKDARQRVSLLMITNDPAHPKVEVRVKN